MTTGRPPQGRRRGRAAPGCQDVEPALRAWDRRHAGRDGPRPACSLAAIRAHVQACAPCRAHHGPRLAAREAHEALRRRELPVDSFEGFFEGIRERVPFTAPGGGMSAAFLDAPHSLRIWRAAAVAASLLLALGVGFVATGGMVVSSNRGGNVRPLDDPRDHLLPAFDPSAAARSARSGFLIRPAHAPLTHGYESFFEPATPEPIYRYEGDLLEGNGAVPMDESERDARFR